MKFFKCLPVICFCLIALNLRAQSPAAIANHLLKAFKKIGYWEVHQYDKSDSNLSDSLVKANKIFQSKLKDFTARYPFTFDQNFDSLKHLMVRTSADKKVKTYSWDDGMGGTLRYYKSVVQFKRGNKLASISINNGLFTNIYTIKTRNKTYYLVESFAQAMTSYFSQGINVWSIENNHLNRKVKLFKTLSGLEDSIDYAYWVDDRLSGNLRFDKKSKTIFIPLLTDRERLTGRLIAYKFTGQYFEKVKN